MSDKNDYNFLLRNATRIFAMENGDTYNVVDGVEAYLEMMLPNSFEVTKPAQYFEEDDDMDGLYEQIELGNISMSYMGLIDLLVVPVARKGFFDGVNLDYEVMIRANKGKYIAYTSANYNTVFVEDTIGSLLKQLDKPITTSNVNSILKSINESIKDSSSLLENVFIWSGAIPMKMGERSPCDTAVMYEQDSNFKPPKINTSFARI